ncbi:Response regulator receiver domain-containing protein [Rheinheimera pacifica]|uniref:histidine kinase n=1 Tax=Rheinheimera pacifica TaxID=173990 RepID=A0A1H6JKF5_9GAMM|nr:response regulator [Rheinheimera pacifica]SEH59643.1 Response regulator receiver domain-containing protein [Rheinheimera pacifica]
MTKQVKPVLQAKILLVEDDEDDYIITRSHLEELTSFDSHLTWVTNSVEGLQKLTEGNFDVCLLDYQLGAETGLSLLKQAVESGISTPIIMLTGQPDKQLDLQALEYGAADFLVKSELSEARFARAIRYALSRREFELERLNRLRLEADNRSKDRFLAHLSHELRTPLSSILGYTELLLESNHTEDARPELNIILNNGKHLLSLLNDILDLSKITANKLELRPEPTSLRHLILDIYTLLKVTAIDNGLELTFNSLTPLPVLITVDGTRLRQVLINLIYNAIKFTDAGSITVDLWTQQDAAKEMLMFRITDTGVGIPQRQLKDIFAPFTQIEDYLTRKKGGAGLGLAISAELIQRMGGRIDVASEEGKGSVFTFSLDPGDITDTQRKPLSLEPSLNNNGGAHSKLALTGEVLIVDDLADLRKLSAHWIQATGASVDFAVNGAEAIAKVKHKIASGSYYDLILMDLHMPGMGGREATVAIRETGYQYPVVALTAAMAKGIRQQLTALGFNDVLSKPITKNQLYRALRCYLTGNSALTDNSAADSLPLHFLVVEDDTEAAQLMQILLESLGVKTTLAHSAEECMRELALLHRFDRILLDLGLPDSDGLQLIERIEHNYPDNIVIVVSGHEHDIAASGSAIVQQSLLKPITKQALNSLVLTCR